VIEMPNTVVRGVGLFQKILGAREISIRMPEGSMLKGLITELDKRFAGQMNRHLFSENGAENHNVRIFLNGRDVRFLDKSETRLADGDIILFLPVLAGG
jgi:molybdopterin converting factor small subunit